MEYTLYVQLAVKQLMHVK